MHAPPGRARGHPREAEGRSNKEVADVLGVSVKTAMSHREHVMKKLRLHDRTDLVKFALLQGVIRT